MWQKRDRLYDIVQDESRKMRDIKARLYHNRGGIANNRAGVGL